MNRSLLVFDRSSRLRERRRADCARLRGCEEAWIRDEIAAKGFAAAQAKCPPGCKSFVPRTEARPA
jgi:hypothetical protein